MSSGDQRGPRIAGLEAVPGPAIGLAALTAPPIGERACVARVVQDLEHPVVAEGEPSEGALVRPGLHRGGEGEPLGGEGLQGGPGRAGAGEGGEQAGDGVAHALVRVEDHAPGGVIDQADGQRHDEFAAAGLGELPAAQPCLEQVQLGFGHLPFEAKQEPVVEVARVIEPVLVEDQRLGERADLQQPVPVGVVAGQPGDLQPDHDPGLAHADVGDQALEAVTADGAGAGPAEILVDHGDLVQSPAQRDSPLPQPVLAVG